MYEAYFNLQKRPFSSTPDSSCFFAPESIQELFDELILRAESGQGIGILTAPAGTGKTLLCRRLASELVSRWTPVLLANSNFPTRRALLQSILFELGQRYSGMEEQELRLSIFGALRELTLAGRGAIVIVDEAHLLSDRLLEELRLLASLAEGELPLTRVILAGQPSLEERMIEPALEALNQRVACHVYLEPLTRRESIEYVEYRIEWAGGICSQVFTDTALESIAKCAGGLPRCLNQLCDHALILAYVQEQPRVTREIVEEALLALRQLPLRWNTPVAAEMPVDAAQQVANLSEASDEDQRCDDEACDLSSEGLEATDSSMDRDFQSTIKSQSFPGETTCIEIGGDFAPFDSVYAAAEPADQFNLMDAEVVPMQDVSTVSMMQRPSAGLAGAGVVPLPDASPQALRGMVDELVVDRYAELDSSAPRLFRTFDDASVPESLQMKKHDDIPGPPEPPAMPAWSATDLVLEEIGEEIAASLDTASQCVDLVVCGPVTQSPLDEEPLEIDDLLGSSVMDACLAAQAALDEGSVPQQHDGHWWNDPVPMINIEDDIVVPEADEIRTVQNDTAQNYAGQYDVIEPEHCVGQEDELQYSADNRKAPAALQSFDEIPMESRPPETNTGTHSRGRYVPKPKYRNIFSTLRRRIGRGT
jgi:type II secretory pathway predicted ATPase ExeA